MHLERCPRWPIRVATVRPGFQAPARVVKRNRIGHVRLGEHVPQHSEYLRFCRRVILRFDGVALIMHHGHEEDAGAGEETGRVDGLEDGVVATLMGVGVEEELGRLVPEDLGRGELEEYFGVGSHLEGFNTFLFPARERGGECYCGILENAEAGCGEWMFVELCVGDSREGADCVGGIDAAAVLIVDSHSGVGV